MPYQMIEYCEIVDQIDIFPGMTEMSLLKHFVSVGYITNYEQEINNDIFHSTLIIHWWFSILLLLHDDLIIQEESTVLEFGRS